MHASEMAKFDCVQMMYLTATHSSVAAQHYE